MIKARERHRAVQAALALSLAAIGGCGGEQKAVETPASESSGEPQAEHGSGSGMGVEAEIGAMDEEATQKAFAQAAQRLQRCFTAGLKRVPYLGGEVRVALRIHKSGEVRWAYMKDSTIGDRETEECMLGVVKSATWPKPIGGEGLIENAFTFEPSPDERAPVDWSADQISNALNEAKDDLSACRKGAGAGPLKATIYVDPEGKVVTAGVSGADERGEAAARCVVERLRGVTYPSPGSYDAKVSVIIDY